MYLDSARHRALRLKAADLHCCISDIVNSGCDSLREDADDPEGWRRVLWFSVFLNVNLAIMNLLPIPVLDGGHIMTSLYEMIARRPLPAEVMRVVYQGCALLLFGFMIFISGFDFRDIFQQSAKEKKPFEFLATGATS